MRFKTTSARGFRAWHSRGRVRVLTERASVSRVCSRRWPSSSQAASDGARPTTGSAVAPECTDAVPDRALAGGPDGRADGRARATGSRSLGVELREPSSRRPHRRRARRRVRMFRVVVRAFHVARAADSAEGSAPTRRSRQRSQHPPRREPVPFRDAPCSPRTPPRARAAPPAKVTRLDFAFLGRGRGIARRPWVLKTAVATLQSPRDSRRGARSGRRHSIRAAYMPSPISWRRPSAHLARVAPPKPLPSPGAPRRTARRA